ncbi:hypothetical protein LEMLEM_LOCUS21466, partial [Lemmus lemmus]
GENCLYSVHVLNKTLIGQAGRIGGSTRQEVEARARRILGSRKLPSESCTERQGVNM